MSTRPLPLTSEEAARYLGITSNALRIRRHRGEGPPGHKLGTIVVYWPEELDAWSASREEARTA